MDAKLRLLLAAATDDDVRAWDAPPSRRPFLIEFERRGVFAQLWRFDAYLCTEPDTAWTFTREPGGFDMQVWRLHLIVGTVPR
jgi:hypothetical protein